MIADDYANDYVTAIKRDTLLCNPHLRIAYCVWCREELPPSNVEACCQRCENWLEEYSGFCQGNDRKGTAKGFIRYVVQNKKLSEKLREAFNQGV